MMQEATFKKILFGILIATLFLAGILIIRPILVSILWGLILAYIFHPLYNFVLNKVKEKNISTLIVLLLIIFLLFVPIWFLLPTISKQIFDVYSSFQALDISELFQEILPGLAASPAFQTEVISLISSFVSKIISSLSTSFSGILLDLPLIALQIVVILFTFFFALRDGNKLKEYMKDISPFSKSFEKDLLKEFKNITNAVIFGQIVTGVVQGLLTGIGLFVAGVPHSLLLTAIAILAAIIPVVGAWLIWVPASIYLLMSGNAAAGIGLLLYGALLISWVDNILRIWIVSRKSSLSSVIVLIWMIGGLIVFGIIGLIIGPLVLSYLIILLNQYKNKKFADLFS